MYKPILPERIDTGRFLCVKKYKGANLTYKKKQKQEQSPYHNKLC